jgi:hypothetical protein
VITAQVGAFSQRSFFPGAILVTDRSDLVHFLTYYPMDRQGSCLLAGHQPHRNDRKYASPDY